MRAIVESPSSPAGKQRTPCDGGPAQPAIVSVVDLATGPDTHRLGGLPEVREIRRRQAELSMRSSLGSFTSLGRSNRLPRKQRIPQRSS